MRRHRLARVARLFRIAGDQLMEQARLALVEPLGVKGLVQTEELVVEDDRTRAGTFERTS
jgi:hypothetical protein